MDGKLNKAIADGNLEAYMKNINVYANSYILCFLDTKWVMCNQSGKKYQA